MVYLPILMKNARLGFTLINLSLTASDDFSGVNRMQFSNSESFSDSDWIPFQTTSTYWARVGNQISVYVRFQDRAGNISPIYSDSMGD